MIPKSRVELEAERLIEHIEGGGRLKRGAVIRVADGAEINRVE